MQPGPGAWANKGAQASPKFNSVRVRLHVSLKALADTMKREHDRWTLRDAKNKSPLGHRKTIKNT